MTNVTQQRQDGHSLLLGLLVSEKDSERCPLLDATWISLSLCHELRKSAAFIESNIFVADFNNVLFSLVTRIACGQARSHSSGR